MTDRRIDLPSLILLAALVAAPAPSRAVETVAPGGLDSVREPAPACPTFHWTADPSAGGFELAVAAVEPAEGAEAEYRRLWTVSLPAGATGWTAAGERCLEAGPHAWSIRALLVGQEPSEAGPWAAPRSFSVGDPVPPEELAEALETVRRFLAAGGDGGDLEAFRQSALPAASRELASRVRGLAVSVPTAAPFGVAALKGTYPGASGETYGIYGRSDSTTGRGVVGYTSSTTGTNSGVCGTCESSACYGVHGSTIASTGSPIGVLGTSSASSGTGVVGRANNFSGSVTGVLGETASSNGTGVTGEATSSTGFTKGVHGSSTSNQGVGVFGSATSSSGSTFGVRGDASSPDGLGVFGLNTGSSGNAIGVYGRSFASPSGRGVYGFAVATSGTNFGVYGESASTTGRGVYGLASAVSGNAIGVLGGTNSISSTGYGVYGIAPGGSAAYAGFFQGGVHVAGNLTKASGSFKIDHPLDPENKYLVHSFVESPDMMNVYNGNLTLDENGEAWVELPVWFEALNRDFRYQLTSLGDWTACWIAREVEGNRFLVRGGPRARVSWQVTGIRRDPWAEAHRIEVEVEKSPEEVGKYLHPREWGVAEERGLEWGRIEEIQRSLAEEARRSVGPTGSEGGQREQ